MAKEPCRYWRSASVVTRLRKPCYLCDSAYGATSDKCAFMMRFLRGLTFDLSGVPKARPLEGRVRRNGTYLSPLEGPRLHFLPGKRRGQNRLSKCHSG